MATKMRLYTIDQFKKRKTPLKGPFTIYVDDKSWKKMTKGIRPKKTKGLPSPHGLFLVPDPFGEGGTIVVQSSKVTLEPMKRMPEPKTIAKAVPPDLRNLRKLEIRFKLVKTCRFVFNIYNGQLYCFGYCLDRYRRFYLCTAGWHVINGRFHYLLCDCPTNRLWMPN
jgi:hypothetical protein